MITNNDAALLSFSEGICDQDLFWIKVRIRVGLEAKDVCVRPKDALFFALSLIGSSLKGLLFKR